MNKPLRMCKPQLFTDIVLNEWGCCRGKRNYGRRAQRRKVLTKHAVIRAEVVPPLRNAVCFIDGNQRRLAFRKHLRETSHTQPFGCDKEKLHLAVEIVTKSLGRSSAAPAKQNR